MTTTPHWPQLCIGLGAIPTPPGLTVDAAGNIVLPSPNQIVGYLPPEFLQLGTQAVGAVQWAMGQIQNAQPAINLAETIASGGVPDPQAIVGAMSATAALVNPVAGAVIGAAGELVIGLEGAAQSLFQSLGLISPPPKTYPFHGGIKQGQCVPYGRADTNCKWQPWSYFAAAYGTSSNGIPYEYVWQHILSTQDVASSASNGYMMDLLSALNRYREQPGLIGPNPGNDFEAFFFPMLKADIENWWNANAAVPPRDLLMGAAAAWNHTHQATSSVVYSAAHATQGGGNNPIDYLLSQWGDIQGLGVDAPDLPVNTGAFIQAPAQRVVALHNISAAVSASNASAPAPSTTSTATKVVAGTAVATGAAVVGTAIYAAVRGEAIGFVLKQAWRKTKSAFKR